MILEDCATYNLLQLLNVELFIYNSSHNIYVFLNNDNVPKCLGSGVCVYIYIYFFFFFQIIVLLPILTLALSYYV